MDEAKLNQLKQFVGQCKSDPSILANPSLSFFSDYLEISMLLCLPLLARTKNRSRHSDTWHWFCYNSSESRTGKPGDVSVYSIFNEDFRQLPGTLNAEHLDGDI